MDELNTLYSKLKNKLNSNLLKKISADIIDAYKNKNVHRLNEYGQKLQLDLSQYDGKYNKLFMRIIQYYHPDKLVHLLNDIEKHYSNKEINQLKFYNSMIEPIKGKALLTTGFDETIIVHEQYEYGEEDFGYHEEYSNSIYEEDIVYSTYEEFGFIEAITSELVGNLGYQLTPHILQNIEGEIDISGYDISDLSGIENLININSLNLSNNNIANISLISELNLETLYLSTNNIYDIDVLSSLTNLKELDISYNEINDITVLLELPNLSFVNLIGNPIKDRSIIKQLQDNNVMVIY